MKFLKFSILLLFSLFFQNAEAQTAHEKYQKESIYLSNFNYIKNGQKYPLGFFTNRLGKELKSNPTAFAEYKKFTKNRNISGLILTGGLIALCSAALDADPNEEGNLTSMQKGLLIGGLSATLVSIPFSVRAERSFHKSIWVYNGELLLPKQ